jgi:O-antigen/teichoic acid export membrane protein
MRRVLELLRRPTVFLAVGLIVSAFSGSVYLLIVNLAFHNNAQYVLGLQGLNTLLAAISTGVMSGIEQEMVRAVSRAIVHRLPTAPVIRRQVKQAAWFVGVTLVACLALSPLLTRHFLAGSWVLYVELMIGLIGAIVSFQVRGTLSGKQDFHVFSITLLVESFTRMLPCLVLLAVGNHDLWLYGLFFALGPVLSAVVGIMLPKLWYRPQYAEFAEYDGDETSSTAEEESGGRAAANLGLLTGATLASQLLLNAVSLLVIARYSNVYGSDQRTAAAIISAVGIARLGIVALLPIQTPLLPKLTTAAERGEVGEVRRRTLLLVTICAGLGLIAAIACATIGPWAMRDIMHALDTLPRWFLATLASATMFMMIAMILQPALIAMNRHKSVMIGWSLGVVATLPVFIFTSDGNILTITAIGALVGPLVTAVFLAVDLWWSMRRPPAATPTAPDQSHSPNPDPATSTLH